MSGEYTPVSLESALKMYDEQYAKAEAARRGWYHNQICQLVNPFLCHIHNLFHALKQEKATSAQRHEEVVYLRERVLKLTNGINQLAEDAKK